jgi:DNA-directed RNA polymerase subunit alpha
MSTIREEIGDLVSSGALEEAEGKLDAVTAEDISPADQHFFAGLIRERQCEWAEAGGSYEAAISANPDHVEAAFRLAVLADRYGDDELAVELYEHVTAEPPCHVNALLNLAVLYEDLGRYDDALSCVNRVLDEFPNEERARLFKKDMAASKGMYYDEEGEKYREKRDALLETPISDFELSVRSRNCLKQMDIHTLGDLLRTTQQELLAYKNFGETSLHEIEAMLSQKSLRIGQLLEEKDGELPESVSTTGVDQAKAGILNRSVAELELSVRSRKCLMRLGINTIGELTQRSEAELLAIKNFGMTSLSEIKRRLAELGLSLRND